MNILRISIQIPRPTGGIWELSRGSGVLSYHWQWKLPSRRRGIWIPYFEKLPSSAKGQLDGHRHLGSSVSQMQEISLYAAACSCELCLQILDKWTPCEGGLCTMAPLALSRPSCLMRERQGCPTWPQRAGSEPRLVPLEQLGHTRCPGMGWLRGQNQSVKS